MLQLCSIFRVPIAIVSLVDTDRQWFKSAQGLPGVSSTSRATSFCAWTLLPKNPEVLIVTDATKDKRCVLQHILKKPNLQSLAIRACAFQGMKSI